MFAVIETGGKQYSVSPGDIIRVESLSGVEDDGPVSFGSVLLISDGDSVRIGSPFVDGASVSGKIVSIGRDKKKIVFKYHSKTRYRKKKGHRQGYTEVEIGEIK
jgi:large subunit ribosomal protein L21